MAARLKPWRIPGRLRVDDRACLEGILFVLRYAVPWAELPAVEGWPSGQTCWRRFHEWRQAGVWERLLVRMQELLEAEGLVDWSRAIADASLVDTKNGAARWAARSEAALGAASI